MQYQGLDPGRLPHFLFSSCGTVTMASYLSMEVIITFNTSPIQLRSVTVLSHPELRLVRTDGVQKLCEVFDSSGFAQPFYNCGSSPSSGNRGPSGRGATITAI